MIGKSGDNEPGFSFAKLVDIDNYKKWEREISYSLESTGIWDHTLPDTANLEPTPVVLKGEDLEDDTKLERQKKRADKIYTWNKNNVQCNGFISYISFGHIQQEFKAVNTDWLAHDIWE